MRIACVLSFFFMHILSIQKAFAWNELCREAIELTAMSAITMDRLRRLKALLRGHDLVDYTWWAAEVRRRIPQSAPLHKQPQTDKTCETFESTCENGLCLIGGLKFFFAKLMNSGYSISNNKTKFPVPVMKYPKDIKFAATDNLKYLVVLLSDLHYPFNLDLISPDSVGERLVDLSGLPMWEEESVKKLHTTKPTLHQFISDVYMPQYIKTNSDAWYGSWTNVDVLGSRYKVEQESFNRNTWDIFEIWANETANLNCTQLVNKKDYIVETNVIRMTEALLEKIINVLRFQIVLAGARIAIVINYILSNREISYSSKTGLIIEKDPKDVYTSDDYSFMFMLLLMLFIGVMCFKYFMLACKQMYDDNIRMHVDFAIQRMRERYKKRHMPHLDIQQG